MAKMPFLYAAVLVLELAALTWIYLTDTPASSDPLSINLGWLGLGSMVALLIYSVARRSRALRRFARLSYWLHFHIFLACQGVMGVLFHCWHLFGRETPINPLNPAFLSGVATLIIFGSGIFGRYLYSLVPRTIGGVQMAAKDVDEELSQGAEDLGAEVEALLQRDSEPPKGFTGLIKFDLAGRRSLRALRATELPADKLALAKRRLQLERRREALKVSERIFRLWIVLHRPMAAILYVIAFVHVAFSYMFSSALAG